MRPLKCVECGPGVENYRLQLLLKRAHQGQSDFGENNMRLEGRTFAFQKTREEAGLL